MASFFAHVQKSVSEKKKPWEDSSAPGETLRTVSFLRNGGSLDELCSEFGLRVRADKELPLLLVKYQQLSAPFHRAITRECRGLVLEDKVTPSKTNV